MRVTAGVTSRHRKKRLLKRAKGFSKSRQLLKKAKETLLKGGQYSYQGRKERKRNFRSLWITRLSAAAKEFDLNYSTLISGLKKNQITIDRKILSELAVNHKQSFAEIIAKIK